MTEKPSTAKIALKWGLITGAALIVYSLVLFLTDKIGDSKLGLISIALSVGGLVLAMRDFRTLNGGFMTWGEGVGLGTLTSAVSGLLSSLFSVFYTTLIDTTVMERMADRTQVQLEESGLTDAQIEQQMSFLKVFQSPGLSFAFGLIGAVVFGLVLSMIIAAIMRRKNDNPFA